jgi:hypothetical protein
MAHGNLSFASRAKVLESVDLSRKFLAQRNNFEVSQHSECVAVTAAGKCAHAGEITSWNPGTKHVVKVYYNLLSFAVKPNRFVSKLDLIAQERENTDESRDGSQSIKGYRRLRLRNVAGINSRKKKLAEAANEQGIMLQ